MAKPTLHFGKWRIRWVDADGKRRSAVFFSRPEADRALRKFRVEADQIRAGLKPRPPEVRNFSELADYWLTHRAISKRSLKDDRSILHAHLIPFFGDTPLSRINLALVDRYKAAARAKITTKTLHNHLTLLISLLNMAVELGWLFSRPKIRKPRLEEREYTYLKTPREMQRLLEAAQSEKPGTPELYATALFTGMRAGELCGLQWTDINFERRQITVQHSYDGPTKNRRIRHVPILDPLLPLLRAWRLHSPFNHVFPNTVGKMHSPSAQVLQECFQRCLRRAGLPRIRFHDLRHTFASHWMISGGDLYKLQKVLGHQSINQNDREIRPPGTGGVQRGLWPAGDVSFNQRQSAADEEEVVKSNPWGHKG